MLSSQICTAINSSVIFSGDTNDYIRSLKCTKDNKALYYVKSAFVTFYDIKSSTKSEELEHSVDVISACTNDMKTVVTSAEDSNVRVWDRTRKPQKISKTPAINANRIRQDDTDFVAFISV